MIAKKGRIQLTKEKLEDIQIFFQLDEEGILNDVFPNVKIISK